MSLNSCAFSSGGGSPEDTHKAELMAFLFVAGSCEYKPSWKPFVDGGWWVAERESQQERLSAWLLLPIFASDCLSFPTWRYIHWRLQVAPFGNQSRKGAGAALCSRMEKGSSGKCWPPVAMFTDEARAVIPAFVQQRWLSTCHEPSSAGSWGSGRERPARSASLPGLAFSRGLPSPSLRSAVVGAVLGRPAIL